MNAESIRNHRIANKKLNLVRNKATKFISNNINKVSEQDVCDFIISEFERENMATDDLPLHFVVVDEHTDDTHWDYDEPIRNPKLLKMTV